jgi:cell division protease FtsH
VESDTKVCFEDVAGVDETVVELQGFLDFLKDPKSFERFEG